MRTAEFHFDFGSPNAYLSHLVIPEMERRTGATFVYVPILLGGVFKLTNNRSPVEYLAGVKNKREFMELEMQRFIRRHDITTFRNNPFFPVNTLTLMRGVVAAQFEGVFEPYFRAAYHHMWVEPKKMDDPEVFRSAFISSGAATPWVGDPDDSSRGTTSAVCSHRLPSLCSCRAMCVQQSSKCSGAHSQKTWGMRRGRLVVGRRKMCRSRSRRPAGGIV